MEKFKSLSEAKYFLIFGVIMTTLVVVLSSCGLIAE